MRLAGIAGTRILWGKWEKRRAKARKMRANGKTLGEIQESCGYKSVSSELLVRPQPFQPLSRRSGRIPALPYPPLRYSQSGLEPSCRAMIVHRTAIAPLTLCLTPGVHFTKQLLVPTLCE
jgi:hypothetical protein